MIGFKQANIRWLQKIKIVAWCESRSNQGLNKKLKMMKILQKYTINQMIKMIRRHS